MKPDLLQNLLDSADRDLPAPTVAPGLALRVEARARARSRLIRQTGVAALLIVTMGLAAAIFNRSRQSWVQHATVAPGSSHAVQVERLRREVAQLDLEAAIHQQAAAALRRSDRISELNFQARRRELDSGAMGAEIDEARDRAARIILKSAAREQATPGQQARGEEEYRRVIELFPDTAAAREASGRLKLWGIQKT